MKKTIETQGHSFEMVMTRELDGYFTTSRWYDLYYKGKKIADDVPSIKSCYNEAYDYVQKLNKGPSDE